MRSRDEDTAELIRSRRTIHDFEPGVPAKETIIEAIELARWAPNHYLTEPWHFYLLGRETAQAIAELNGQLVANRDGAASGQAKRERWLQIPGWMVVTCDRSDDPLRAREDYAACCCAVHNIALFLWSRGIGMKWTTGAVTREAAFYDLVWVDPEFEEVVGLLWYGYPKEVPTPQRRPLEQILVELP